ncbi:MAG TPA: hypothetical protein V6D47_06600 [Oscillatoriaceae cyanobacterium]
MIETAPTITLDVHTAAPEWRRRLRAQAMTAVLPGGLALEEGDDEVSYRLETPSAWTMREVPGGWCLEAADGQRLTIADGALTLTIAK